MSSSTSAALEENHEEDNSTLTVLSTATALADKVVQPETAANSDSLPGDASSDSSSTSNQNQNSQDENSAMRPFVDPGLVVQKSKDVPESWLSDFVSPTSAPRGAYSPLSQTVKKLLPERTACRLGKTTVT